METTATQLSVLNSPSWSTNLDELTFNQFKRTYSGGYSINFVLPLSGFVDTKTKNYTNFYLSRRQKASDFFSLENTTFSAPRIRTPLQFGESYLAWEDLFDPYRVATFIPEPTEAAYFDLELFSDQVCHISTTIEGQRYYLVSDVDNTIFFIDAFELDLDDTTSNQPHQFTYMFDSSRNYLFLFQEKASGYFSITKTGNSPTLVEINTLNKQNIIGNKFLIAKDLVTSPEFNLNSSFITYNNNDNNINDIKSAFDLENNFLLHNKIEDGTRITDIIVLKNQMDIRDKLTSSNNLLSGEGIYANNMRNYTSINDTILSEQSTDLELNYTFNNLHYTITPGKTRFVAPSSMYPFTTLNINDTKFVDCGAFSFDVPAFADKVYQMNRLTQYNNQHYLCTWLSGSPMSDDKIWVDRYYYPDLIDKAAALAGKPIFQMTYDDIIENLIENNATLESSVNTVKFFDKVSDLTFIPNEIYIYDRISASTFGETAVATTPCNSVAVTTPLNYFKTINQTGAITFSFYFLGDNASWTIRSDRNNINCGITIQKDANNMTFSYVLYDPSTGGYQTFEATTTFKRFKENFVCFGLDLLNGVGYVYFNNTSILDIDLPVAQYIQKQLLYGDIFYLSGSEKVNILELNSTQINTIQILDTFTPKNVAFTTSIFNGKISIDNIQISLPCGMRNNFDNIHLLQTICGNDAHRSNRVNIKVKNLNVSNATIVEELSSTITRNIKRFIPATTVINDIEFIDFK